MKLLPISNITDISANFANYSTDINVLVRVMDFTDVPMLKIWPILADINIGTSLIADLIF